MKPKHLTSFLIRAQVLYKPASVVDKPMHAGIFLPSFLHIYRLFYFKLRDLIIISYIFTLDIEKELTYANFISSKMNDMILKAEQIIFERKLDKRKAIDKLDTQRKALRRRENSNNNKGLQRHENSSNDFQPHENEEHENEDLQLHENEDEDFQPHENEVFQPHENDNDGHENEVFQRHENEEFQPPENDFQRHENETVDKAKVFCKNCLLETKEYLDVCPHCGIAQDFS